MSDYKKLVSFIIENVGGKDNIENVTHCVTRLRFKLVDDARIDKDQISNNKEIITTQFAGGKFQVVIGTHVGEVYEEVLVQTGVASSSGGAENNGSLLDKFTSTITQIMTPVLGVLGGCALILALSSVLVSAGLVQEGDGAQVILSAMGNACLTFFPVILGYTSAKAFGLNPFIGMILGSVLMFPGLVEGINANDPLYSVFANSVFEIPVHSTFFGIPIMFPATGYTSSVIPIVFVTFFAAKVEKVANKVTPNALKMFIIPTVTVLVAGVVGILLIGPISIMLTNAISAGVSFLFDRSAFLAIVVITLIYQPLVILGLHWALISIAIINFVTHGSDVIISTLWTASFAHLAVCSAVYLRSKNQKTKSIALPAVISACFCIIEPSIYGITLPVKKRFAFCMFSGMVGGLILGLTNTHMYAATMGVTGFPGFINPQTGELGGMLMAVLAVSVTMVIGFLLTWLTYKPEDDGILGETLVQNKANARSTSDKVSVFSPMKGKVQELSRMKDKAFASSSIGKGICIIPEEGKVVAPFDGTVTMLFPTGHAVGVTSNDGVEVLIHIGTNTVQLPQDVFNKMKQVGDVVKKGDVLVTFDLQRVEKEYDTETAVVVANCDEYLDIVNTCSGTVNYEDELLVTIPFSLSITSPLQEASI